MNLAHGSKGTKIAKTWPGKDVLVAFVIRVARQNGESAVKLLQQDDAGQFVREGDLAKREKGLGLSSGRVAPAISRADGKQQLLRAVRLVIFEKVRDLFRGELLAARVEQYQFGRGAALALFDQFQQRRF